MKKIRLITFHTPKNYGAVLQAFSLMSCLKRYSNDVKIVDYNTKNLRNIYSLKFKISSLKRMVKYILNIYKIFPKKRKYKKFDEFVNIKMELTERFESFDELVKFDWKECVFVTGSDQVFNPNRIKEERKTFYLNFVQNENIKISYAASFGVEKILNNDSLNEIKKYLLDFSCISTREKSGANIVKEAIGIDVPVVLDPVFLHDKDFWKSIAKYRKIDENYLLYYRLMNDKICDKKVVEIAKNKKLKLIVISSDIFVLKNARIFKDVGPEEFLGLFENADFVATDSFHGVAFSLIFEKQFVFMDETKLNDRGLNLLDSVGLKKNAYIEFFNEDHYINYDSVKAKLQPLIQSSLEYLESSIHTQKRI